MKILLSILFFNICFAALNVEKFDSIFDLLVDGNENLFEIGTNFTFTEGPVWIDSTLYFSDVRAENTGIQYKYSKNKGLEVWRKPSGNANGNAVDLNGNIVTVHHNGSVTQTNLKKNKEEKLVETYNGVKLNSPNDIVVNEDGSVWFSDPIFGCCNVGGLNNSLSPQKGEYIYRFEPKRNILTRVVPSGSNSFNRTNGLAFNSDKNKFYYATSLGIMSCDTLRHSPWVKNCKKIADDVGDGLRLDRLGNIWVATGGKIKIFTWEGKPIGSITPPVAPTNLSWDNEKTLYITARTAVYSVRVNIEGKPSVYQRKNRHRCRGRRCRY